MKRYARPISFILLAMLMGCGESEISNDNGSNVTETPFAFVNMSAESLTSETKNNLRPILTDWDVVEGQFSATKYNQNGFLDSETHQGLYFFTGGDVPLSIGEQTIIVAADMIEKTFEFSAELGGYDGQQDHAVVELFFMNSNTTIISKYELGPVTNTERGNNTKLLRKSVSGVIPSTAVQAKLRITLTRFEGSYNDGYVDNIKVVTIN